jgi:hypothetical protein
MGIKAPQDKFCLVPFNTAERYQRLICIDVATLGRDVEPAQSGVMNLKFKLGVRSRSVVGMRHIRIVHLCRKCAFSAHKGPPVNPHIAVLSKRNQGV